jgi:FMN phosphatase YigB (HAD superfamily)
MRLKMKKTINYNLKILNLSEEHIKQICRFTKTKYVQGEWQRWQAFAKFKWEHLKLQQERDEILRKIRGIEQRTKQYPPPQSVLSELIQLKDALKIRKEKDGSAI